MSLAQNLSAAVLLVEDVEFILLGGLALKWRQQLAVPPAQAIKQRRDISTIPKAVLARVLLVLEREKYASDPVRYVYVGIDGVRADLERECLVYHGLREEAARRGLAPAEVVP